MASGSHKNGVEESIVNVAASELLDKTTGLESQLIGREGLFAEFADTDIEFMAITGA